MLSVTELEFDCVAGSVGHIEDIGVKMVAMRSGMICVIKYI